jgi:hypothetical protein
LIVDWPWCRPQALADGVLPGPEAVRRRLTQDGIVIGLRAELESPGLETGNAHCFE